LTLKFAAIQAVVLVTVKKLRGKQYYRH